jgi:tape measure domain-containing protein
MAVVADRVIVELEAKLDRYEANVRRAEAKFDSATRSISANSAKMARDIERNSAAAGSAVKNLVGTLAAAFSAQQVAGLADSYTRFTNQLKVAGLEGQNLAGVQSRLFDIAQQYGVQLESIGTLYGRATAVSKELGASQQQLTQFTVGVAAALKIQGTSATESQGALLQLGQLLGSGRVQVEEFNSVLEGARPILQAVANNFEGAGGSVSKLKQLVNDGKVSNQAFFQAFLAGSQQLEAQATKSTATISQGFTILTNALSLYIGQTDASLGASERINAALILLADNLDKVSIALGILGAVLLGRFVAGMVGAAASTGVVSTAIFAMQARAVGAATTMEALALTSATAGRAMLAAFGGPVGLAVTALTLGIAYFATTSNDAAEAADGLKASIDAQSASLGTVIARQQEAAAETNNLTVQQRAVLTSTASLTGEVGLLANAWGRVAAQAKSAALEQARAVYAQSTLNIIKAGDAYNSKRDTEFRRAAVRPFAERGLGANAPALNSREALAAADRNSAAERQQLIQAARNRRAARAEVERLEKAPLATFKPAAAAAPPGSGDKPKKPPKGDTGPKPPDPDTLAGRFADDLANAQVALAQATADVIGTLEARATAERVRIENDRVAEAAKIKAEKNYTDAQREQLLALNEQIAAQRRAAVDAELRRQAAQDAVDLALSDNQNQRDLLNAQRDLADSAKERRDISLRLVELQYQEERLRLEAIVAAETSTAAEKEIARRRLAILGELEAADKKGVERDAEGPLARYRRQLGDPDRARNEVEDAVVKELEGVRDSITNAVQKTLGIKNPILAALINNFIEQQLIKPLLDAMSGVGGAGGAGGGIGGGILGSIFKGISGAAGSKVSFGQSALGSILGGLFGGKRASGGHVNAGRMYQVNESGVEGFQPAGSGKIIPLGRMNRAGGASINLNQTVNVDTRGSVNPDGFAENIKAAVRQETLGIVGTAVKSVTKGVPARVAQYQRDGT